MQSELQQVCDDLKIRIDARWADTNPNMSEMPQGSTHWKVRLWRYTAGKRREISTYFSQGPAHTKEPTTADVLSCLMMDASMGDQDFEAFCSDLGYDNDSRKAERIWKACAKVNPKVRVFLGSDFNRCAKAEH